MQAMNANGMYANGGPARVRAFAVSPAFLPAAASWLHVHVCIDGKTGTGTRRLGGLSP